MKFTSLMAPVAAIAMIAAPVSAVQSGAPTISQVERHIASTNTMTANFTQTDGKGRSISGTLSMKRPGKVRFEYNPPEHALVLAWSGAVYVFDRKVGGQPETYPLNQTPLSIILDRNVNLAQAGMVTGHQYDGTATIVTAQDPKRPEYGSIQMKFTGNPVELRQWVIRDGNGSTTTVVLGGLEKTSLPNSVFDVNRVR